jgi:hypothetical protein
MGNEAPEEWPPTDETPMHLTLPVKDVRALAAHLRHVRPVDVEFDPGWLADELSGQVQAHYRGPAPKSTERGYPFTSMTD